MRELLKEFNGIRETSANDRKQGRAAQLSYLDLDAIPGVVDMLLKTDSDFLPPADELRKVVFFWQVNGYSTLFGIRLTDDAGVPAGTIVRFDYELDELRNEYPDLMSFVRDYKP